MDNDDRCIELIRNRQVSKTEARNSMGCSENWYDPVFAITEAFSNEEVEGMTDREIRLLIRLAEVIADGLY